MATCVEEQEIVPETVEPPAVDRAAAIKNIEHIQMCLLAAVAAAEAALNMLNMYQP